jgi:E3 ubiquitin-protein ligase RBBP6
LKRTFLTEYNDNGSLIPKNTSLIIARIPLANQSKKPWDINADRPTPVRVITADEAVNLDLSTMNGSEEDKIAAMMKQSTSEYDPLK